MSKFDQLLETYNQQISEQIPAVPTPVVQGSSTPVSTPSLNQQTNVQSGFKNTTAMERMKDFWDMLVATQTNDQATVKRIS